MSSRADSASDATPATRTEQLVEGHSAAPPSAGAPVDLATFLAEASQLLSGTVTRDTLDLLGRTPFVSALPAAGQAALAVHVATSLRQNVLAAPVTQRPKTDFAAYTLAYRLFDASAFDEARDRIDDLLVGREGDSFLSVLHAAAGAALDVEHAAERLTAVTERDSATYEQLLAAAHGFYAAPPTPDSAGQLLSVATRLVPAAQARVGTPVPVSDVTSVQILAGLYTAYAHRVLGDFPAAWSAVLHALGQCGSFLADPGDRPGCAVAVRSLQQQCLRELDVIKVAMWHLTRPTATATETCPAAPVASPGEAPADSTPWTVLLRPDVRAAGLSALTALVAVGLYALATLSGAGVWAYAGSAAACALVFGWAARHRHGTSRWWDPSPAAAAAVLAWTWSDCADPTLLHQIALTALVAAGASLAAMTVTSLSPNGQTGPQN